VEDAPPALLAELPAAANLAAPVRRWRALVVDDVEINRDIAASFLRAAGHDVACAEGGQEGVTAAAEGDFDVILMDVRMPEVDGLEATRRIRQLHGARGKVPVVALTAQVFADEVAACRAAGMDDHLAKPFSPVALLEVIAGAIRRSSEGQPGLNDRAPEAPAIPQLALAGADLPTLDLTALEQTAAHLPEGRRASHLRSLADRTSALLEHVRANERGADPAAVRSLAAAAHALSGSAGMFGFLRLAAVTRQFEHAVARGSSDCTLTASLIAACQAALAEMQRQVAEPADSEMAVAAL
jgi:CheY-like chemotaxis protein